PSASAPSGNTIKNASPWVSTTVPPAADTAARTIRSCSPNNRPYSAAPKRRSNAVEPSTSVNRNEPTNAVVTAATTPRFYSHKLSRRELAPQAEHHFRCHIPTAYQSPHEPLNHAGLGS